MVGLIVAGIVAVVVAGPRAFKNVLEGTHDFADGGSVQYRNEGKAYRQKQYEKYNIK